MTLAKVAAGAEWRQPSSHWGHACGMPAPCLATTASAEQRMPGTAYRRLQLIAAARPRAPMRARRLASLRAPAAREAHRHQDPLRCGRQLRLAFTRRPSELPTSPAQAASRARRGRRRRSCGFASLRHRRRIIRHIGAPAALADWYRTRRRGGPGRGAQQAAEIWLLAWQRSRCVSYGASDAIRCHVSHHHVGPLPGVVAANGS